MTADGKVIGVNFAGTDVSDENFAIADPTMTNVLNQLKAGEPVDWIGINGLAIFDEETGISGVWVAAVESGSPAARIGITGGDIITRMENLSLALDGTMSDYCDILRTQGADQPIAIEVLRFATEEYLSGTLNQDTSLTLSFSFAQAIEEQTGGGQGGASSYSGYQEICDDSGVLCTRAPFEWADINGAPCNFGEGDLPCISAAPNLDEFFTTFHTSGVTILVDTAAGLASDPAGTASSYADGVGISAACVASTIGEPYSDALDTGAFSGYTGCDGTNAQTAVIVAVPDSLAFVIIVEIHIVTDADLEATDEILASFYVIE
jgi:serine protease Do